MSPVVIVLATHLAQELPPPPSAPCKALTPRLAGVLLQDVTRLGPRPDKWIPEDNADPQQMSPRFSVRQRPSGANASRTPDGRPDGRPDAQGSGKRHHPSPLSPFAASHAPSNAARANAVT